MLGSSSMTSKAQFSERFKGKKAISSDDFISQNADYNPFSDTQRARSTEQGDNLAEMADDFFKSASEGVAQAADEVTNAFSDFLNKGYA